VWLLATAAAAQIDIVPTTTLAKETGNNTSAADSFKAQTNGNAGAGNVSKLPIRSLLYPGASTKVYAHFMPWFGYSNHMNVGYSSDDPAQVKRQVADMVSRGIDGAIVDWYGPGKVPTDTATALLMREAEANPGFEVAIVEDAGAIKSCYNTAGCDVSQKVIDDLNYVADNYYVSPAYMRFGGRPVMFFFGLDAYKDKLDWSRIRANVRGNPLFIFRNSSAYTQQQTNGGFSWLATQSRSTATDGYMSLGYLDDFYKKSLLYPSLLTFGSGFKGFDDSLAAWGQNRYIGQYCGRTWLESMARAGLYYSAGNQLPALQLVTWNDYEEGTSLESGLDNCLSISASLSGTQLRWSLSGAGSEATIDHYRVYVSLDGQNLMKLADVATGVYGLDLAAFGLKPAGYTLHVQAYGKPSFQNKMSNAVAYTVVNQPPTATLALSTASGVAPVAVTASILASDADGSIASGVIDFGDATVVTAMTASRTYKTAGTYTVKATVTDDLGATTSATQTVTVSAPSVTIHTPTDQATVATPTRIRATALSGAAITVMKIYVDGVASYEVLKTAELDTSLSLAAGTRRVTVQAWDAAGAIFKSTMYVQAVAPSVTILAPGDGTSGDSPLRITAQANSAASVTAMKIYVDHVIAYENWGTATLDAILTLAPGTRRITVQAWDSAGAVFNSTVNVVVNPYVTIHSPYDYSSVNSPVRVSATAYSSVAVKVMRVYVDNKRVYETSGGDLQADIRMSSGGHRVTVQATDSSGAVFSRTVNISVQKAGCSGSNLIYGGRNGC
jgi:hypothetical protein